VEGDDRLQVENVLYPLVRPIAEVDVVLERKAYEFADRVLDLLGQISVAFGRRVVADHGAWLFNRLCPRRRGDTRKRTPEQPGKMPRGDTAHCSTPTWRAGL